MTTRVGIEPGDGLIGRFGDTIILIHRDAGPASDADEVAGELLGLAAEMAADPERPANMIAARLATWVIGRMTDDVTAFGIVTPVPGGVVMFLRGAVWCEVTQNGSTRQMSGAQALSWVDQIIPAPFERLAIGGAAGRPVQAYPQSDLRAGVVPGQGFVLTPLEAASREEPAASREEPAPSRQQLVASHEQTAASGSGPATPSPSEPPSAPIQRPTVDRSEPVGQATVLARPRSSGRSTAARASAATTAPLGTLASEHGPAIPLDRNYVLGRDPQHDPLVQSGAAAPVAIPDSEQMIS